MKNGKTMLPVILMVIMLCVCAYGLTSAQRAQAYYQQGYLYYTEGSYNLALPEFLKALKLSPNMYESRYWMAKTYYKLGNYQSTVNQCKAALVIKPNDKNAKYLMAKAADAMISRSKTVPVKLSKTTTKTAEVITSKPKTVSAITVKPAAKAVAVRAVTKSAPAKRTVSLNLRNVDISTVLEMFSKETGISIIAGKDVYGKVTVELNKVDPDDALDMILKSNGYTYMRNGNVVQVYSSGEPVRMEELPGGIYVRTFMINYIGADELKDTLTKLMPEDTSIYTTKGSKTIVVKGNADEIKRADALIRNMDIPPRQVMVEAKIIEVDLNAGHVLGMNASYTNPDNPSEVAQTVGLASPPSGTGATGLYYSVTNLNVSYLLEALSTRTGFNILSSPKVMALNEQKAQIITGSRLGYTVKTVTTTGLVESVEFMDVGTMLQITPSIKSDGLIVMDIHPEVSDGSIVNNLPQKNSTETTTQLIVKDGQTIIIGGLVREVSNKTVKGVPFLMDIPLLGSLFKRTDITTEKKEIIVLISPRIVNAQYLSEMEESVKTINARRTESTPSNLDLVK